MKPLYHKAHVHQAQKITLGELAEKTNATLKGDPQLEISGVGTLAKAKQGEITFLASPKYRMYLAETNASAVVITPGELNDCKVAALVCSDPKLVMAQAVRLLYPFKSVQPMQHPTALIGKDCEIHPHSHIGPHCVIGDRVKIGANVVIEAGVVIGDDCTIGEGTVFYPRVTVYYGCQIGKNCLLHSGCVIGSDGFGFAKNQTEWFKVPQIGVVKIGDRVEVGANTTIDRGAIEDTEIANDVILDNQIQIGHNVKIGEGTAIAACSGIAGSTVIGKHCLIGGGSRINGHINITDFVIIVGCTNVAQSISTKGAYGSGISANDIKSWKKNLARFHQLDELAMRLIELEKKLQSQEEA